MLKTNKSQYFINSLTFLFCLIPFALLTGPFLPDLIISIVGVIFLIISISKRQYKYYRNNFVYLFVSFWVYLIISSLLSDFQTFSLQSSLVYFRFGVFALATWFLLDHSKYFGNFFFIALLATFLFALFDGFFQYIFDQSIFGVIADDSKRLALSLNDKMILGGYLARLFPLLFALIIINLKKSLSSYLLIGTLFILTDTIIYITGERTALGLMFISTMFIILFTRQFKTIRIISFIVSIFIIIAISLLSPEIKGRNIDNTINQLGITTNENSDKILNNRLNYFSPQHESMALTSLNIFFDNKLIGSGPNTYRKLCNKDKYNVNEFSCSTHPHNTYLQLLSETGIIGLGFIFVLFFHIFKEIYKNRRVKKNDIGVINIDYKICLICTFIITLWPLLPTLNFFNNWINVIYYLPIGFYLKVIYGQNNNY